MRNFGNFDLLSLCASRPGTLVERAASTAPPYSNSTLGLCWSAPTRPAAMSALK